MALAFNIEQFRSNGLVNGGSRPNQYQIIFAAPLGLSTNVAYQLSFLTKAASIPAMSIGTIELPYFGRVLKEAGDRRYRPWDCTVMLDEDFEQRAFFESWNNKLNYAVSNMRDPALSDSTVGAASSYKIDIQINQLTKTGDVAYSYMLVGAWPSNVGQMRLAWEQRDQIHEFDVEFEYDYFVPYFQGVVPDKFTGVSSNDPSGATFASQAPTNVNVL